MDAAFLGEQDSMLLRSGCLRDRKYCISNFKREMQAFLEKQVAYFFQDFSKAVERYVSENDEAYLLLIIRRYNLKYRRLYFFTQYDFLEQEYREKLMKAIEEKRKAFYVEMITYFDKIAMYTDSMCEVPINIKRLIEV